MEFALTALNEGLVLSGVHLNQLSLRIQTGFINTESLSASLSPRQFAQRLQRLVQVDLAVLLGTSFRPLEFFGLL